MELDPTLSKVEDVISVLRDLIAFPVLGGESNLSIASYIESTLKEHHIQYHQVYNDVGDKVSLHCRIGPPKDEGIILSGHMDVVPTEGQPWSREPFTLSQEGNRLYGRGTADMKGFLACCLAMIPEMQNADLKRPIYLAFSYDEEVGCLAGPALAHDIKQTYNEQPGYAIIGEPTSMITCTAGKGIAVFTTEVKSSAAHSSEIKSRVSAINEATHLIQWLNQKMEALSQKNHLDQRFDPAHTTIHVGTIAGGTAVNIISDHCVFQWDVRNIPSDDISLILSEFVEFCKEREATNHQINPDFQIDTKAKFSIVPSLDTALDSPIAVNLNQWTHTAEPSTVAFGTEAGQFDAAGFEAVICGPGDMAQGHQADEYVEIDQLEKCTAMIQNLIKSQCL